MIATMFDRGRRLFTTASLATVTLSLFHLWGTARPVPPAIDPIAQAMQNTSLDMGFGMAPSMWDLHQAIAFTMGICLGMMGLLGLIFAATSEITARALTRTAAVYTAGFIGLAAMFYLYRLPVPVMIFAVLALLWGVAQRTTRLA